MTPLFKVYIAGPMRRVPLFNFPLFKKTAAELRALDIHVYSPAEMDELFAPEISPTADGEYSGDPRPYVRRDLHIIVNELHPPEDGLLMLPDWQNSTGATGEHAVAKWCRLNIWYSMEEICQRANQLRNERARNELLMPLLARGL